MAQFPWVHTVYRTNPVTYKNQTKKPTNQQTNQQTNQTKESLPIKT